MALINNKLRRLRDSKKLKGRHIFSAIGLGHIHDSEISRYFNGSKDRKLHKYVYEELARYFNVDYEDYLANDNVEILDNPEEKYPYLSREEKEAKRLEELKSLRIKVSNFDNIDLEFKKDTLNLLTRLEDNTKKFNKLFKEVEKQNELTSLKGIYSYGMYCNLEYYKLVYRKVCNTFGILIKYFECSDGVSFYQAVRSLNNIDKEITNMESYLVMLTCNVNRVNSFKNHSLKIVELAEEIYTKNNYLIDMYENSNSSELYNLILACPVVDVLYILQIYYVLLSKQMTDFARDNYNINDSDYILLLSKISEENLRMVYDEDGAFNYESGPQTAERLYNFLMKNITDEQVYEYIDNEYFKLKEEYEKWLSLVNKHLTK